jgi:hypothetical protein
VQVVPRFTWRVQVKTFTGRRNPDKQRRYKLFFEPKLRDVVLTRLRRQLQKEGFCAKNPRPRVQFGLAAGKVQGDEAQLKACFRKNRWELLTPTTIRGELKKVCDSGYQNSVGAVIIKLLLRDMGSDGAADGNGNDNGASRSRGGNGRQIAS